MAIVTTVERTTAFMLMEKLKHGKNAIALRKVIVRLLREMLNFYSLKEIFLVQKKFEVLFARRA
jgi:hypothetical protein